MQSTVHSEVIVAENHRAKVKSGQAELGCIARSVFPIRHGDPVRSAPDESQRAQRVIFTGWLPSFLASSFLFSACLHDPCLKYAMKRRRCCESRGREPTGSLHTGRRPTGRNTALS